MADDRTSEQQPAPAGASGSPAADEPLVPSSAGAVPDPGYTPDGVPTLEGVRERIESRYGTALGATELAQETPEGRAMTERYDAIQKAAAEKLKEIRASMEKPD